MAMSIRFCPVWALGVMHYFALTRIQNSVQHVLPLP